MMTILAASLLNGCVMEKDLKEPLDQYMEKTYGIKSDDYHFLKWDNNWLAGVAHQTAIEIEKPYETTAFISLERDTYKVESEEVYTELVKGAYVQQYPGVFSFSEKIIKKYGFMEKSPVQYDEIKKNFYYYMDVRTGEAIKERLTTQFKDTQRIDLDQLLPDYAESNEDEENIRVHFAFYYNTHDKNDKIPNAKNLVQDYEKSEVLAEGLYSIGVRTIDSKDGGYSVGVDKRNSTVLFRVDSGGGFRDTQELTPEI